MHRILGLALAGATMLSTSALAAPERVRVRGTVTEVGADSLTVQTASGAMPITLDTTTRYLEVEKASLGTVEPGSYIGTATKTEGAALIALEVVVFPPAMKGAGEGHYGWDEIPDTTVAGAHATGSMMTNGTVASSAPAAAVSSTMTNGAVAASTSQGSGSKTLTVTYKGGEQTIVVPPTAPIVTFKPGTMSEIAKGKVVFISATKDGGKVMANMVAIGTPGANPPM